MTVVLIRRPWEDTGRDCCDAAISQGMPSFARTHQKPGRGKERAFRGWISPLIPWFQTSSLQNCERINFFVLSLYGMFVFFNKFIYFIYLFLAALGLRCCSWAFPSYGERALLFTAYCSGQASHCGGFSCCGARALGTRASVIVACGLSSCGTRA